jgi:cytochrome c biogenesis protein CcdA
MRPDLLALSLLSGLFAALSPCSLPVYPVLLNILARSEAGRRGSAVAFALGLAFMFSLFYVALGFMLELVGDAVFTYLDHVYAIIYLAAAVLCFLFALQSLGKIRLLSRTFGFTGRLYAGVPGAFLTGVFFGTVLSPCNLPFILTGVLPVVLAKTTIIDGLLLMFAFSFSLSLPVLILGVVSGHAMDTWVRRYLNKIEAASALFLVAAGSYFLYMLYSAVSL